MISGFDFPFASAFVVYFDFTLEVTFYYYHYPEPEFLSAFIVGLVPDIVVSLRCCFW